MSNEKRHKALRNVLNIYTGIGIFFVIGATILILMPYLPYLWYRINGNATTDEANQIALPIDFEGEEEGEHDTEMPTLPPLDTSLSEINMLSIPKIGVNGAIHEGQDAHAALEEGIWRVHEFGTPEDLTAIIIAAHRFGYLTWSSDFRTTQSFYNLPKTGVGDTVEIIWNQRKYEYRITVAEDSTIIANYDADLILYTCRLFNSPVRVFRYAERVN